MNLDDSLGSRCTASGWAWAASAGYSEYWILCRLALCRLLLVSWVRSLTANLLGYSLTAPACIGLVSSGGLGGAFSGEVSGLVTCGKALGRTLVSSATGRGNTVCSSKTVSGLMSADAGWEISLIISLIFL